MSNFGLRLNPQKCVEQSLPFLCTGFAQKSEESDFGRKMSTERDLDEAKDEVEAVPKDCVCTPNDAPDSAKSETWIVEQALEAEIAQTLDLLRSCLPNGDDYSRIYLEWLRTAPQCRVFVVKKDGTPIACALLLAQADFSHRRFGHVHGLCVAPDFRRRGIATALLRAAHEWFRSFSAQYSALHVPKKAKGPRSLYAKHGYTCETLKKNYYDNKEAAFLMKKTF